jgi:predicted ATPase
MKLRKISLVNWKNFRSVSADIKDRLFIVGANASGKSNFLDAIRFMRDIVKHGGGLRHAVSSRGGVSKIRCLSAREDPNIQINMGFIDDAGTQWEYILSIGQEQRGKRNTIIKQENITRNGDKILSRPNKDDETDEDRLTQTHLEQITTNKDFRDIVRFLESIKYTHLVPQLLKFPDAFSGPDFPEDPFGRDFLRTVAQTSPKTRDNRLQKIRDILRTAVPQLNNLTYVEDIGQPHLEVTYKHWRPHGAKQPESQLSDGTLRMIGLLWSLLDGQGLLLLEEPELSLHTAIVEKLPELLFSATRAKKRQIIMTTHSSELLSDKSISLSQILLLKTGNEGTTAELANEKEEIRAMLNSGMTPAEMVIPYTQPDVSQGLILE